MVARMLFDNGSGELEAPHTYQPVNLQLQFVPPPVPAPPPPSIMALTPITPVQLPPPQIAPPLVVTPSALGDPNMSFLGTLGRGISGALGGFLKGGPVGAVAGGLGALTGRGPGTGLVAQGGGISVPSNFPGAVPTPGFGGTVQRFLPGGKSGYEGAPPGYHVNKRYLNYVRATQFGKHVQDPTGQSQVVNVVVKNRKMNPLNPRALRRAVAREHAAVRLMRRAMRGTGYHITRSGYGKKSRRR